MVGFYWKQQTALGAKLPVPCTCTTRRCVYSRREVSQIGVSPMHGHERPWEGPAIVEFVVRVWGCMRAGGPRCGVRAGYPNKVT